VAILLIVLRNPIIKYGLLAWIGTLFLVYRLSFWVLDIKASCGCLGNTTAWIHIKPATIDVSLKVILASILVVGYSGLVITFWKKSSNRLGGDYNT